MQAGQLISGKYRLRALLGAGAMGSVWAARNELTDRDFAVKFLRPELSRSQDAIQRFFHEARACGQIRHPAIVDVFDVGQADDGAPYIVMELLEGEAFDHRLARENHCRPADVCRWVAFIARGLEEAHARGLVHRDLKPGNIFFAVDKAGDVLPTVLDFGISKEINEQALSAIQTTDNAVLGSPAYMSPEQARGDLDIDIRTDVWSLGVIMYEALTGEVPFDAGNYNALMVAIINEPHRPVVEVAPEVPASLSKVVDDALVKDRRKRIQSAAALAEQLERVYATLTHSPLARTDSALSISTGGVAQSARRGGGSSKRALLAGAALAVLGLVGGAVATVRANAPPVLPAGRIAAPVRALAARAEAVLKEETAARSLAEAEARAREARSQADRAEEERRQREEAEKGRARAGSATAVNPNDPHGGVNNAGF